jgi:hypothetical protein
MLPIVQDHGAVIKKAEKEDFPRKKSRKINYKTGAALHCCVNLFAFHC